MKSNGFKSRFSAAPSSAIGIPAVKTVKAADAYFASARQKSQKLRNYFDDDEDEDQSLGAGFATNTPVDGDDYDPLDAFM